MMGICWKLALAVLGARGFVLPERRSLGETQRRCAARAFEAGVSVVSSGDGSVGPRAGFTFGAEIVSKAPCLAPAFALCRNCPESAEALAGYHGELEPLTRYLRPSALLLVHKGVEVAFLAHCGQLRRSGEPYVTHPLAVAGILAQTQMDRDTVIAGLLHDTVEDTALSFADVEVLFNPVVRKIVEGETKVSKLPKMARAASPQSYSAELEQVENLRSMFIAMAEDWRIVVVKLADRLHNMRTLEHMPEKKRLKISRETLEIFAPLAHRLGMWQYKTELEETSFKFLHPLEYAQLDATISAKRRSVDLALSSARAQLEDILNSDEWLRGRMRTIVIEDRIKSTYSTWKKMQRNRCGLERVDDLVALRVVLRAEPQQLANANGSSSSSSSQKSLSSSSSSSSTSDEAADSSLVSMDDVALCYHVLGKVHGRWTPLPRTLKDYISSPKPNGYRSLHTTVLVGSQPLEIQIRTDEMHRVAELGAAAHWAYKDDTVSLPWLHIVKEWHAQVDSSSVFMELVRNEILGTRVFVFAPRGHILNLAKGATLADAVAQINLEATTTTTTVGGTSSIEEEDIASTVAQGAVVAAVNGAANDPIRELRNGDIISFVEQTTRLPATAERRRLNERKLRKELRDDLRDVRQPTLQDDDHHLTAFVASDDATTTKALESVDDDCDDCDDREDRLIRGGRGRRVGDNFNSDDESDRRAVALFEEQALLEWSLCEDCYPLPGDVLRGCVSLGKGDESGGSRRGSVHRAHCDCDSLKRELASGGSAVEGCDMGARAKAAAFWPEKPKRTAPRDKDAQSSSCSTKASSNAPLGAAAGVVASALPPTAVFNTSLVVFCRDRTKMLLDITSAVSIVNILDVTSETKSHIGLAAFHYTVHVNDLYHLDDLIREIHTVPDVLTVIRGTMRGLKHIHGEDKFWDQAHSSQT